jgi:MarR family
MVQGILQWCGVSPLYWGVTNTNAVASDILWLQAWVCSRLGKERLNVAELADQVGRDYTTASRQLARLKNLRLIERPASDADRRASEALLTDRP